MNSTEPQPRIPPATAAESGWLNAAIVKAIWRGAGTKNAPNLFATLARHGRLFRGWLWFAGALMPGGKLPRVDTELVILRVAHNCGAEYEWRHHERLAQVAGLTGEQVQHVRGGGESGWSGRQLLLLRAADELHERREISDELWSSLSAEFSKVELIELVMLIGHYEMLATVIGTLRIVPDEIASSHRAQSTLAGRRVLITGAARGIGAATARRLHERGARVVVAGIEPELLERVAEDCGDTLAVRCDVRDREQVEAAVQAAVDHLGGLDVIVANAGVAAQLPILGGDPAVFERTLQVNLLGTYYTLRAAAPHIAHDRGYALAISSLAAAVHPPLLAAYSASKAGVEALGDALRIELASSGARVGVAYFAELDTDMTSRGFGTEAASRLERPIRRVAPLKVGVDAIERGIINRSRRVVAPKWVGPLLPVRMPAQRVIERFLTRVAARDVDAALEIARNENAPLTTELSDIPSFEHSSA